MTNTAKIQAKRDAKREALSAKYLARVAKIEADYRAGKIGANKCDDLIYAVSRRYDIAIAELMGWN